MLWIVPVPADTADKALGVVGAAQRWDHLPSNKLSTAVALGAIQALVVLRADVLSTLLEEAGAGQVAAAHCRKHTRIHLLKQTRQTDK